MRGEVRFLSAPSTCSQFLPSNDFFAIDNRPPGMRWLLLDADGRLETEVSWV
jgi:Icc protein